MDAHIRVYAGDDVLDELDVLYDWLAGVTPLRGAVVRHRPAPADGEMGAVSDVLMVALGGGGAITALAASLGTWLVTRRSHIKVKVTGPGGRTVELDVKRAKDDQVGVEKLVREVLSTPAGDDA